MPGTRRPCAKFVLGFKHQRFLLDQGIRVKELSEIHQAIVQLESPARRVVNIAAFEG